MSRADPLVERALKAVPPPSSSRSKYVHLLPIVSTLRSGGFSLTDAVNWLIREGEVPENRKASAYRSIRGILLRQRAKTAVK